MINPSMNLDDSQSPSLELRNKKRFIKNHLNTLNNRFDYEPERLRKKLSQCSMREYKLINTKLISYV